MSDSLEEEKRKKLIEAGRRALEERKKKRQQTPDGTSIDVKGPNSAPTVDLLQSRRSDLESLRLSTLRAKQELELNKTTNESTDFSVRNDKTLSNGNTHPFQSSNHVVPSPTMTSKFSTSEQINRLPYVDSSAKELSSISTTPKIPDLGSSTTSNGMQSYSPKSDFRSALLSNNGHSTTTSVPLAQEKYPNVLSPFKPDFPLPSQQPTPPILPPTAALTSFSPLDTTPLKPQPQTHLAAQPLFPEPTSTSPVPILQPSAQAQLASQVKSQSPNVSPRFEQSSIPSFTFTNPQSPSQSPRLPSALPVKPQSQPQQQLPSSSVVTKPAPQQESLSPMIQPAKAPLPMTPVEQSNGSSQDHPQNNTEPIANGTASAKNGSLSQQDKRLQVLMEEVSNKNKELEEMRLRMEQYQQKYNAELKKNEKLMDKLEFIKRKEIEERPILEEIVNRETLELVDKLKDENEQLKNLISNLQTQLQSLEKKSKQQLETISQLMSEKNQITQEMQRRIDRILESQAMNLPSQLPSSRPEIPNSAVESAQMQGKDAIRRLLEEKANLENKINEQWETIQSMSRQKTELLTRLANEAQRNEALIKENSRLRNATQAPPSPTSATHQTHSAHHPHTNGQHNHVSTAPSEIEVVQSQSSGGWLTYIPIVGYYFSPAPTKPTKNV